MKSNRLSWLAVALGLSGGTALASIGSVPNPLRSSRETPADRAAVSPECRQFLSVPADSTSAIQPWALQLSFAACRESIELAPVSAPENLRAMVASLERAYAPSIAIYRDAMSLGPPSIRILGAYGLGMSYVNIAVRARSAIRVPRPSDADRDAAYIGRLQLLHHTLEPMLAADLNSAAAAFDEVTMLADDNPAAANADDVITTVVAYARAEAELLH